MLKEALPASAEEKDVVKTSDGEAWTFVYNRYLININPKQAAS
jgi:hypothetical protein